MLLLQFYSTKYFDLIVFTDDVGQIEQGKFLENRNVMCYIACIYTMTQVVSFWYLWPVMRKSRSSIGQIFVIYIYVIYDTNTWQFVYILVSRIFNERNYLNAEGYRYVNDWNFMIYSFHTPDNISFLTVKGMSLWT